MALEAIPQALWFFLPAYVANPMAVVFGGGAPMGFGRTLRGGRRLLGGGKTWRGVGGGGGGRVAPGPGLPSTSGPGKPPPSPRGWARGLGGLLPPPLPA